MAASDLLEASPQINEGTPTPFDCLVELIPRVHDARTRYLQSLSSLPATVSAVATKHFHNRIARAMPRPLLGEFVPLLICDILNIPASRQVQETMVAWFHIYFSVMMLDDVVDRQQEQSCASDTLTGAFLFQRGIHLLRRSDPHPFSSERDDFYDRIISRTVAAGIHELGRRSDTSGTFSTEDFETVGSKLALLQLCVVAFTPDCMDAKQDPAWLHNAIASLATTLQLLDDVTDWQEDLTIHHMTLPLTLAFCGDSSGRDSASDDAALPALLWLTWTGAFHNTLECASVAVNNCLDLIDQVEFASGYTMQFLRALALSIKCASRLLTTQADRLDKYLNGAEKFEEALGRLSQIATSELFDLQQQISAALAVVAQGS